jgi:nucleoside-diphosphate-sugar epimerase
MAVIRSVRLTRDIGVRMAADAIMVAGSLFLGLSLRVFWLADVEGNVAVAQKELARFGQDYLTSLVCILAIVLPTFCATGLYTRGRTYRVRYKARLIIQAVSLSYLVFGFIAFLIPSLITLPRGALFPAWIATMVVLIVARAWTDLWASIVLREDHNRAGDTGPRPISNVLVIGGAGYIGSALLPKLLDRGYHVRLLDLLLFGPEPVAKVIHHPNLEIIKADFRQVDKVVEAVRGIDAVIHLGAIVGDPACALDEELTTEVNLMATRMIAEVAKGSGVDRFIFASTCSVYGASDEILDERSALSPVSLYARSKIASETVLAGLADSHFSPVILRFGTVYGLSGRNRFDLVINLLTAKGIVDGQITVYGGSQWRPFVHVDDVALAVFKVLEAPRVLVDNQIFNVGSDEQNYTIEQIGKIVHRLVPTAELVSMGSDTDRRNYRVSFRKIHEVLGFSPRWTVEDGVQQVIAAMTSGKVQDYRDARYNNAQFLRETGFSLMQHQNGWAHALLKEASVLAVATATSASASIAFPNGNIVTRIQPVSPG